MTDWSTQRPLARADGLTAEPFEDEVMVFDRDTNRAHHLNAQAREVWQSCDGIRSVAELAEHCDLSEDVVWQALADLDQNDLLVEPIQLPGETRRGMFRTAALVTAGVAVGVPVIRSIAVPTVAHAQYGCQAIGQPCGSGHTNCPAGCICGNLDGGGTGTCG